MLNVSPLRRAGRSELWGTDPRVTERRKRVTKLVVLNNSQRKDTIRMAEPFLEQIPGQPAVRGFLHRADNSSTGLVLTHGAGSNCNSPLLVALAESLCAQGDVTVLRCDLPFRQARPHGPPIGTAENDQEGLRQAVQSLRKLVSGRVFLGGHSYGGRMATMLGAQDTTVADGLLLLSYPLHPPRKPQQLRTAHFPKLHTPAFFVHGTRDPFGSIPEMESALKLIPAKTRLVAIEGAGHEILTKSNRDRTIAKIVEAFGELVEGLPNDKQSLSLSS